MIIIKFFQFPFQHCLKILEVNWSKNKLSLGTSHVLEHLTLSGSNLYPIRDSYLRMQSRSLCNYLNA